MNHDAHNVCQHGPLAYCRACDAVYCRGCAREWPTRVWHQIYPVTTWVDSTTGGEAGSTTITGAGCRHT